MATSAPGISTLKNIPLHRAANQGKRIHGDSL